MNRINAYLKTTILLAGLTSLFLVIGYYVGGNDGMIIAIIFGFIFNFISYWFSDRIVLSMSNAKRSDWNNFSELETEVYELCKSMNIPVPKLYIMESIQPNAFATGRNPKNGVVCLTTGLLNMLEKDQVLAGIAHELAHIKNYDILIGTLAAVIVSAISSLINILRFIPMGNSRDDRDGNPLALLLILIISPILAMLLQFAISRSREFVADETAGRYTKKPQALAEALISIDREVKISPMDVNSSIHSLFIHSPISRRGIMELFSTHPLTEKRIQKLMEMKV